MFVRLKNVDAQAINERLTQARMHSGAGGSQVFTLVVVTDPQNAPVTSSYAHAAGELHPSRVLLVIRDLTSEYVEGTGIDAEIHSGEAMPGDMVTLWLAGEAAKHTPSLILPLLLPELPVVIWLPGAFPDAFDASQIARLSTRRIVDTSFTEDNSIYELDRLVKIHEPGTTDMSWARLTRWRALLVAMLDQAKTVPSAASIKAPLTSAPAKLLGAWLEYKLGIKVELEPARGPGIENVTIQTDGGELKLRRRGGTLGIISLPGQPDRPVALARREIPDLIGEELVRLNGDEMFDKVMGWLAQENH